MLAPPPSDGSGGQVRQAQVHAHRLPESRCCRACKLVATRRCRRGARTQTRRRSEPAEMPRLSATHSTHTIALVLKEFNCKSNMVFLQRCASLPPLHLPSSRSSQRDAQKQSESEYQSQTIRYPAASVGTCTQQHYVTLPSLIASSCNLLVCLVEVSGHVVLHTLFRHENMSKAF